MQRQNTCYQCGIKVLSERHETVGSKVSMCTWYGELGLPPFIKKPDHNDPVETKYLNVNLPIEVQIWYCSTCLIPQ